MRLIGKEKLLNSKWDVETGTWVSAWIDDVLNAQWGNSSDILENFPRAKRIGDKMFVFPILSTDRTIKVVVCFVRRTVCVTDLC